MQTGHMLVFGSSPYPLLQLQKAFVLVSNWTWVSIPITASYSSYIAAGGQRVIRWGSSVAVRRTAVSCFCRTATSATADAASEAVQRRDNFKWTSAIRGDKFKCRVPALWKHRINFIARVEASCIAPDQLVRVDTTLSC